MQAGFVFRANRMDGTDVVYDVVVPRVRVRVRIGLGSRARQSLLESHIHLIRQVLIAKV